MKMDNIGKTYIVNMEGALKNHWTQWGKYVDGQNRVLTAVVMEMDRCMVIIK